MVQKRVLIVDVAHLCYKAAHGGMPPLSATVNVGGVMQTISTVIPKLVTNQIYRWSKGGYYPTVVCFDSKGANKSRKAYFTMGNGINNGDKNSYKGSRSAENDSFYNSVNLTLNLMNKAGVCCLKSDSYEADDLIKASVDLAKKTYPDLPIDIVTGDSDLLPLVDEQVSVFLTSRKATYAVSDDIKKTHYVQITPDNYEEYLSTLTAYKNLYVPYNTVLLTKLLRGDKADEIAGYPKFTPTKFKNLVWDMERDGVDIANLFRYDNPTETICYRSNEQPIPEDMLDSIPNSEKIIKYGEPPALKKMCEILSNYLEEDVVNHVRYVYNGINLNSAFTNVPDIFKRRPAKLTIELKGFNRYELHKVLEPLRINLPNI